MTEPENKKLESQEIIKKNDFIELEFAGKIKDNGIFDTNIPEEAKKLNLAIEAKPLAICLGQAMLLPSIDEFLIGKLLGKYKLELPPEKAFGFRKPELVKIMPASVFKDQQIHQGMVFQFDNVLGRISAISGGRIIVDFNNPIAGKQVIYELNAKRKIQDLNEKIKSLISFFFRQDLKYEVKEKKIIIQVQPGFEKFALLFKPKFKEILDLDLEVKLEKEKEVKEAEGKAEPSVESKGDKEITKKSQKTEKNISIESNKKIT